MNGQRLAAILMLVAGILFLVNGLRGTRNTTDIALGVVFLLLAGARFRRQRRAP